MDKANAVYQTIVAALYSPKGARVLDSLSNPYIYRVFELSRATASEAHHLKGFLRFSELQNGVLFSIRLYRRRRRRPLQGGALPVLTFRDGRHPVGRKSRAFLPDFRIFGLASDTPFR